jgi:hypothetical protein
MTIEEVVFDQNKAYSQKGWAFLFPVLLRVKGNA